MVWEDLEEDDLELLEASDGEARQEYYRGIWWSLVLWGVVLTFVLALFFLVYLYAKGAAGT